MTATPPLTQYQREALIEKLAREEDSFLFAQEIETVSKFAYSEAVVYEGREGWIEDIIVLSFPDCPPDGHHIAYEVGFANGESVLTSGEQLTAALS